MKDSKQSPRKGTPRSTQSYYDKYKNEQKVKKKQIPVYIKVNPDALKEKRPNYPPHCSMGEKCICEKKFGTNVGKPEKNLAVIRVIETEPKVVVSPIQFRPKRGAQKSQEDIKLEKACIEPAVEAIKNKEINFAYRDPKSKKYYNKPIIDKRGVNKPETPPPPIVKLIRKKKDDKKGTILEERTKSMPLYKAILSKINVARWKIYKVSLRLWTKTIMNVLNHTYSFIYKQNILSYNFCKV